MADYLRDNARLEGPMARYAFGVVTVAAALALRLVLTPWTGAGAPFVLFYAATLVTALLAGVGPALVTIALSLPLATTLFGLRGGTPVSEAIAQAVLYGLDGLVVVYLTVLMRGRRLRLEDANQQLLRANEERARTLARTRDTIELSPDAYFVADLDGRLTDVNQAACRLLGYAHDELVGMTIFDIIAPEEYERLHAVKAELLAPGRMSKAEWIQRRKDGTLVPVEVSSNILPDGRWQAFVRDIAERKRIEDERQVLVSLLDYSSDFIGIADPGGTPIYLNAAGRRMIGLAPDFPVRSLQIHDCYPPELRPFVTDVILKTAMERGHWSGETLFQNIHTHETIPVSDTHFVIRDTSGSRILGIGTVTRDISEARRIADERERLLSREQLARQQAESAHAQVRESEERFRTTIDEAPIGMALVALDGRFVRVNRALGDITAYAPDELTRLNFQDITHSDDRHNHVELAGKLARGEIPRYQLEKRFVRKDRSLVDVMISAAMLHGPDGAPRYYITQIEDITVRKRADEALRLSEAKFSGIISIASDAIISADQDQRITVFNEGAERIFGYSRADMLGTAFDCLIPERFRAAHREHFGRFAAGEEAARAMGERREIFGLRKTGEEFPAEASISKVSVDGSTFFSVVLRDVTYRKSVEEALQRAVTARDDVLGIVAHDLRNPLNTILMQASLLERPAPEPERRDPTPQLIITRSAKRMNHLIKDLLDVAVIEAGQLKVERERVAVPDLAREAVETQAPLAESSGLELRLELDPGVRDVWGDRSRLLQVLENLVGNAIKFTAKGGRITVGAVVKDGEVEFAVADTGTGIAPENLPHLFDPFWQATTRAGRLGAGLGLPITRGIVEAHGGRIRVESTVGRGSTFFFTIPSAPADANRPAEATKPGPATRRSNPRRRHRQGS